MSDYLDNLIAQSVSSTEMLRPRPVSLFEPPPATSSPAPLEQVQQEAADVPEPVPPRLSPRGVERPAAATRPAAEPAAERPSPEPAVERPAPEPVVERAVVELTAPPATRLTAETVSTSHEVALPSAVAGPEHRVLLQRVVALAGRSLSAPIVARPQVSSHREPASSPVTSLGVQPEPTIHVTIGRVEVRAVMPPAAPVAQPSPPPGPKLTLEEYLKRRSEG